MFTKIHIKGLLALAIVILFGMQECRRREAVKEADKRFNFVTDTLRTYKLKNGQIAAQKQSLELSNSEYKEQFLRDKKEKQLLKERIGNLNNLLGRTEIGITIHDTLKTAAHDAIIKGDTVKSFRYLDRYLSLNGIVHKDSVSLNYAMKAKLDIVLAKTKKGIIVNVVSDNPNLSISGIKDYRITEKKKFYQRNSIWFIAGIVISGLLLR